MLYTKPTLAVLGYSLQLTQHGPTGQKATHNGDGQCTPNNNDCAALEDDN
jgi:hypothetical protein